MHEICVSLPRPVDFFPKLQRSAVDEVSLPALLDHRLTCGYAFFSSADGDKIAKEPNTGFEPVQKFVLNVFKSADFRAN
jgi:hypothetical protein